MSPTIGRSWRVGAHYGIHVYEGERPVATFHDPADAQRAVDAINTARGLMVGPRGLPLGHCLFTGMDGVSDHMPHECGYGEDTVWCTGEAVGRDAGDRPSRKRRR